MHLCMSLETTMKKKNLGIILAVALLVVGVWLLYEFVLFFIGADNDIKAALIGVFGVTFAALFSHYFAQKREIDSRLFSQKVKAYEGIFDLIFELLKGVKKDEAMSEEEMLDRAMVIKRDLMIWAGSDVLKAWRMFELESSKGSAANVFRPMERIFRALRKELGHRDITLADGDMVKWLVQASDHSIVDKEIK